MPMMYEHLKAAFRDETSVATATLIGGSEPLGGKLIVWADGAVEGSLGDQALDERVRGDVRALLVRGETRVLEYPDVGAAVFVESFVPPPRLFMVGGVHIAVALAALAKVVGFRTIVVDARSAFATPERFAHVDELVVAWPDEALEGRLDGRSCVAVLTHDPKLDDPALRVALRSPARYIGALGSPTTHARRRERLRVEGFDEATLARINGPIGLSIRAKTPEEIAVSILAQIIQVQRT